MKKPFKEFLLEVHPDPDTLGVKTVYDALDEIAKLAENYLCSELDLKVSDFNGIMANIEDRIEKPIIDARFGDHWKISTQEKLDEGFMNIQDIIRIAWKQGRKSILLERAVKELLQKIEFIKNQQGSKN